MLADVKTDTLKRLSYVSGHLDGVRRMIDADAYCVDVLKQTFAIRRAIEKLESVLLDGHLRSCVVAGVKEGREEQVLTELRELYEVANR